MIPSVSLLSLSSPSLPPFKNPNPDFSSQNRCRFACRSRRTGWDSNAEPLRTGRFRRKNEPGRKWWSDDEPEDEEFGFGGFDDEYEEEEEGEEFWDKFWIFKVFKSYGYMLPAIIASMLLATGPKAFLMALALPLGQSAISLAIDRLWGRAYEGPRRNSRSKRRKPYNTYTRYNDQEESVNNYYKPRNGYQSWVSEEDRVADEPRKGSSFGGWDEMGSHSEPTRKNYARDEEVKMGKFSKKGRYRDVPLFMRLLVAVFPFLDSWTRLL